MDMSVTIIGQKLTMPLYCSVRAAAPVPAVTSERTVTAAAAKFGTMFGVSSLGTSVSRNCARPGAPLVYQFSFQRDRELDRAMMKRAKDASVDVMMLTMDGVTGGNRGRDLRTGF